MKKTMYEIHWADLKRKRVSEGFAGSDAIETCGRPNIVIAVFDASYNGGADKGGHDVYRVRLRGGRTVRAYVSRFLSHCVKGE